jgi:hypothetical protein
MRDVHQQRKSLLVQGKIPKLADPHLSVGLLRSQVRPSAGA